MLANAIVGTNDAAKAIAFYDALLAEVGAKRAMNLNRVTIWAAGQGQPLFAVAEPVDGAPASVGNGSMVSFGAANPEQVDKLYAKAIELGAADEGAPGPRENAGLKFYAAYFRDLDGNKLNFFCM